MMNYCNRLIIINIISVFLTGALFANQAIVTSFLQKTYIVNKNVQDLHNIYADLFVFSEYHPLIEEVSCAIYKEPCTEFDVSEKPYSWFFAKVNYYAEVEVLSPENIQYTITELFFLKPKMFFTFSSIDAKSSKLTVRVEVKGPIFTRILARKMMNAQDEIVRIMNNDYLDH